METRSDAGVVAPPSSSGDPKTSGLTERLGHWIKTRWRLHVVIIGVLVLALAGSLGWAALVARRAEGRRAAERASLVRDANDALVAQSSALLRLSALPLGWAIRGALLKNDLSTVDAFLQRMINERHVAGAALIGTDQKVELAGNRKLEKKAAQDVFPGVALDAGEPTVLSTGQDVKVVVPVMGYDRRLGTVILSYALPSPAAWGGPTATGSTAPTRSR
jgi:hypothetical protein